MFRSIFLLIAFLFLNTSYGQDVKTHSLFFAGELNLGNFRGVDFSANYAYKEKYSFSLRTSVNFRKSHSTPDNYSSGLFTGILTLGLDSPKDILGIHYFTFGRLFKQNIKGTKRFNIQIGLSYTTVEYPYDFNFVGGLFVRNYTWNYNRMGTIGLLINPKIEYPRYNYIGFTISPFIHINRYEVFFGFGFGSMILYG